MKKKLLLKIVENKLGTHSLATYQINMFLGLRASYGMIHDDVTIFLNQKIKIWAKFWPKNIHYGLINSPCPENKRPKMGHILALKLATP